MMNRIFCIIKREFAKGKAWIFSKRRRLHWMNNTERSYGVFLITSSILLCLAIIVVVLDVSRPWSLLYLYQTLQEDRPQDYPHQTPFGSNERVDRCRSCHMYTVDDFKDGQKPLDSHPFPELYVSENSPHSASRMGCTVCHGGCGESLSFTSAGHNPSSKEIADKWIKKYQWTDEPIHSQTMIPLKYVESSCLTCHSTIESFRPSCRFPNSSAAKLLRGYDLVQNYKCTGCHIIQQNAEFFVSRPEKQKIPLTDIGLRMDKNSIYEYIKNPQRMNPKTKMPQFFGLSEIVGGIEKNEVEEKQMWAIAQKLSEMKGDHSDSISTQTSILSSFFSDTVHSLETIRKDNYTKGLKYFVQYGCASCHSHRDTERVMEGNAPNDGEYLFIGPDLSNLAQRYNEPMAATWIAEKIREPAKIFTDSRMPKIRFSNPLQKTSQASQTECSVDDPVIMIVYYLMSSGNHTMVFDEDVTSKKAENDPSDSISVDISQYGCTGCHVIPRYSSVQIGPELTCFGNKPISQLDFSPAVKYLSMEKNHLYNAKIISDEMDTSGRLNRLSERDLRLWLLSRRDRSEFVIQKLLLPRSFEQRSIECSNVQRTATSTTLRMGYFASLTPNDRVAIATYLLGLQPQTFRVTEDLFSEILYQGRHIIQRYGCLACHIEVPESITVASTTIRSQLRMDGTVALMDGSERNDIQKNMLYGMYERDSDGCLLSLDTLQDGKNNVFHLWRPLTMDTNELPLESLLIPENAAFSQSKMSGGRYFRQLMEHKSLFDDNVNTDGLLEKCPPVFISIGGRIQPSYLEHWLQNPISYRPSVYMPMPRFLFTSTESRQLVEYFSAVEYISSWNENNVFFDTDDSKKQKYWTPSSDELTFPYFSSEMTDVTDSNNLMRVNQYRQDAWKIVRSPQVCGQCHAYGTEESKIGPDLKMVAQRLTPTALRQWITSPRHVRPWTSMPSFFTSETPQGMFDDHFESNAARVDAIVDFLIYDANLAP